MEAQSQSHPSQRIVIHYRRLTPPVALLPATSTPQLRIPHRPEHAIAMKVGAQLIHQSAVQMELVHLNHLQCAIATKADAQLTRQHVVQMELVDSVDCTTMISQSWPYDGNFLVFHVRKLCVVVSRIRLSSVIYIMISLCLLYLSCLWPSDVLLLNPKRIHLIIGCIRACTTSLFLKSLHFLILDRNFLCLERKIKNVKE